jgi:hypothetical protein
MQFKARAALGLAIGLLTLTGASSAGASSPAATLKIEPQASLQPDGSALLTVDYSCTPGSAGSTGGLFTGLQQPGAFGSSGLTPTVTCDDQTHRATVDESPGPFTPGSATAIASMVGAGDTFTTADAEVKVS